MASFLAHQADFAKKNWLAKLFLLHILANKWKRLATFALDRPYCNAINTTYLSCVTLLYPSPLPPLWHSVLNLTPPPPCNTHFWITKKNVKTWIRFSDYGNLEMSTQTLLSFAIKARRELKVISFLVKAVSNSAKHHDFSFSLVFINLI